MNPQHLRFINQLVSSHMKRGKCHVAVPSRMPLMFTAVLSFSIIKTTGIELVGLKEVSFPGHSFI